ncbi:hypothetical protein CR513_44946, partial [Mucuna pruriens]
MSMRRRTLLKVIVLGDSGYYQWGLSLVKGLVSYNVANYGLNRCWERCLHLVSVSALNGLPSTKDTCGAIFMLFLSCFYSLCWNLHMWTVNYLCRYVHKKFSQQYKATIGADFVTKEL